MTTQEIIYQKEAEVVQARTYLKETDWQITAKYERNRPISQLVAQERLARIAQINTLEAEIQGLYTQLAEESAVEPIMNLPDEIH